MAWCFSTITVDKGQELLTSEWNNPPSFIASLTSTSTWGNSLSYAAADANSGSASPVTLADTLIDDNKEIIIMTDKACNGDCGTVREGTVAYRKYLCWLTTLTMLIIFRWLRRCIQTLFARIRHAIVWQDRLQC